MLVAAAAAFFAETAAADAGTGWQKEVVEGTMMVEPESVLGLSSDFVEEDSEDVGPDSVGAGVFGGRSRDVLAL